MAITNKLQVKFNYAKIDDSYDFYVVTTVDKYIKSGAFVLDKPLESLRADSVVFDNGRSLFIMFKKGMINRLELVSQVEDEKLSLKQVNSFEIKDYILFRLFLFSLNNYDSDEIKFNNITGKFYITSPSWLARNKKSFKALNINVDQNLNITGEATTFTHLSLFNNPNALFDYPRYVFSDKNCSLKRVLRPENNDAYIRKSLYGQKAEIPFFSFYSNKELRNNKVFYLYETLELLSKKFSNLFEFSFDEIEVLKTLGKIRDKDFIENVKEIVTFKDINVINWSNSSEYDDEFKSIVEMFTFGKMAPVTVSKNIVGGSYNLIFLHNKEYYEQNKYNDPYKNFPANEVIQHITIEDSAEKIINDDEAIYETILKEFLIKDDILNNKPISLDNWSDFNFDRDYVFGREKDGVHYFIIVKPNGRFEFYSKKDNLSSFGNPVLDACSDYLTDNKGKEKTVIANSSGDIIVISRTPKYLLPSKEIFMLEKIGRDKESRNKYLEGVIDINLYNNCYSVGIKGSGMNTRIPKAPHLYQIDVINGVNFIEELLETMAVTFVKYNYFTVMPYPIKYLNEYILISETKMGK